MEIRCCMVGCDKAFSKSEGEGEMNKREFYGFPKDFNMCMLWVQNSGRAEYFEDFAFAGAQPFLNRHICSDHFNDFNFIKRDPKMGILPGSIPNINLVSEQVDTKEEIRDSEYTYAVSRSILSESELLNEIKMEKIECEGCNDVNNTSFSFSSTDDDYSCNDLHGSKLLTPGTIGVYKETEQDKQLSNEFFKKYEKAVFGRGINLNSIRNKSRIPNNEMETEQILRLRKEALRAKIRRSQESEDQKKIRRMKNALRAAFRRQNETPEQRGLRKKKDKLRSQRRRKAETVAETRLRRYNDAVRAAFRRTNETEEQRMERKMKDIIRAAKRRSTETLEQRADRLRKDRERASRKRMLKKITKQMTKFDELPDFGTVPHSLTASSMGTTTRNESTNIDHFQQVLEFIKYNTSKCKIRPTNDSCTIDYLNGVVESSLESVLIENEHRKHDFLGGEIRKNLVACQLSNVSQLKDVRKGYANRNFATDSVSKFNEFGSSKAVLLQPEAVYV